MEQEKIYSVELILREHIVFQVPAVTALVAMEKIKEKYWCIKNEAKCVYESDSHILVEEPCADGFVYLDLRNDECNFSKFAE